MQKGKLSCLRCACSACCCSPPHACLVRESHWGQPASSFFVTHPEEEVEEEEEEETAQTRVESESGNTSLFCCCCCGGGGGFDQVTCHSAHSAILDSHCHAPQTAAPSLTRGRSRLKHAPAPVHALYTTVYAPFSGNCSLPVTKAYI